ncbi:hypothetical protein B0H10DRAFT_1952748 [Mycena sp. CBHHK59/15]|nr:hypothetical protein B0H10DRAFT_1952748 [Mycena sp. CBHHK59/15]
MGGQGLGVARQSQLKTEKNFSTIYLFFKWQFPLTPGNSNKQIPKSESEDTVDSSSGPAPLYTIAKKAPFTRVSVESLERDHGANDFLWHLANFLRAEAIIPCGFDDISAPFSVYKRVVIKLQPVVQVSDSVTNNPIRAVCGTASSGLTRAKAAHFNTVLACKEKPTAPAKHLSLDGKFFDITTEYNTNQMSFPGLFAGRVRAIFALPVEYGSLTRTWVYGRLGYGWGLP